MSSSIENSRWSSNVTVPSLSLVPFAVNPPDLIYEASLYAASGILLSSVILDASSSTILKLNLPAYSVPGATIGTVESSDLIPFVASKLTMIVSDLYLL